MKKSQSSAVSPATSLASAESLSMPLFQEVVISADIGCTECQKRLANMMSKMGEIESIVVNALEKKVTLVCRYPPPSVAKISAGPLVAAAAAAAAVYRNPLHKFALIKRLLRSP